MDRVKPSKAANSEATAATDEASPFSKAIELYLSEMQKNEDTKSPFYQKVLSQLNSLPPNVTSQQILEWANSLNDFIIDLQQKQEKDGKTIKIMKKLKPFVDGLQAYNVACDIMVQATPSCIVLLYGGARLLLDLAQKFTKCFEKITEILERIGDIIKCYEKFSSIYQGSPDMEEILVKSYKHILSFWQSAAKLLSQKGLRIFSSSLVKSLDTRWKQCESDLDGDRTRVLFLSEANLLESRMREDRKNQRKEIVSWIQGGYDYEDPRYTLDQNLEQRHPNTCSWLNDNSTFKSWCKSTSNVVAWYSALPGAGKTILASSLVKYLQDLGYKTVHFFYSFSSFKSTGTGGYPDSPREQVDPAIRSLVLQLLTHIGDIPTSVIRIFENEEANHSFKLTDPTTASKILIELLNHCPRVHIIIDGLDECGDRRVFESRYPSILQARTRGLSKWFFTSRDESYFRHLMERLNATRIIPFPESIQTDIATYVGDRESNFHCTNCMKHFISLSDGSFLWVRVMLDIMSGENVTCDEEAMEQLNRFPKGMAGLYLRSIQRLSLLSDEMQALASQIIAMLVTAWQPLRLSELRNALSTRRGAGDYSENKVPRSNLIEELCSNLVVFDRTSRGSETDPRIKLAHKTVQDFFLQDPDSIGADIKLRRFFVKQESRDLVIGQVCLAYLSFERYQRPANITAILQNDEDSNHAFLKYAATFWYAHLNECAHSEELFRKVLGFVQSPAFWTCVAVQSKIAPHLLWHYSRGGEKSFHMISDRPNDKAQNQDWFASPLPRWLEEYGSSGSAIIKAFMMLIKEWHPLLVTYPEAIGQFTLDTNVTRIFPGRKQWESPHITASRVDESVLSDGFFGMHLENITWDKTRVQARIFQQRIQGSKYQFEWQPVQLSSPTICTSDKIRKSVPLTKTSIDTHLCENGPENTILWILYQDLCLKQYGKSHKTFECPISDIIKDQSWGIVKKVFQNTAYGETLMYHCALPFSSHSRKDEDSLSSSDSKSDSGNSNSDSVDEISDCLILLCEGHDPIWLPWTREHSKHVQISPAFHPTESIVVWSHSPEETYIEDLRTGHRTHVTLPGLVDVPLNSADCVCQEFRFSRCSKVLYYLLCSSVEGDIGTTCTLSFRAFHFPSNIAGLMALTPLGEARRITYQFDSMDYILDPFILTEWSTDLFVALPSLRCSPKLIRISLVNENEDILALGQVQTLKAPIYFSSTTPFRRPQLIHKLKKDSCSSHPGNEVSEGLILAVDRLGPMLTDAKSDSDPSTASPASIISWSISMEEDWRDWDPVLDECSLELKQLDQKAEKLRGTFVDAEQTFSVPIRSGLDWKRRAFLSCY